MGLKKSHRVGARAVVINQGKILLNEFGDGLYYNLPGGGVEKGELIREAVVREVMEETGISVDVGEMLYVLEYEPVHCENLYGEIPQISIVFNCVVTGDITIKPASVPDRNPANPNITSKAVWMPIDNLKNIEYVPYIHESLMRFIATGCFTPNFLSEPLLRR
ncbi:MAG: NUDIX domain-containing protein [Defluviitaleaceae bacterium]|nr:NUDIX domain-containing protein [Defluviitaleaceae bacterium]MCL2263394.1 NUDIX domain-containing protein [Defluviitaleaceae bacterium]